MNTDTCLVPLTQSQFAIVSLADWEFVKQFRWHASKRITSRGIKWYAARRDKRPNNRLIYLHRVVAQRKYPAFDASKDYDHWDGDGRNCTRQNIRPSTHRQNCWNSRKRAGQTSVYKGVSWSKQKQKWSANIFYKGKNHHLGLFEDEIVAAAIYAAWAIFYFGPFACFD